MFPFDSIIIEMSNTFTVAHHYLLVPIIIAQSPAESSEMYRLPYVRICFTTIHIEYKLQARKIDNLQCIVLHGMVIILQPLKVCVFTILALNAI